MSKAAYENYFRQPAPEGAVFGADKSWFQATADGDNLDYETCLGYWLDTARWAYFVNVRHSYGSSGDDGAQALHWQCADDVGYNGKRGGYHFIHAQSGVVANFNNFMKRTEPYADRLTHYMGDYEASPNAGANFIKDFCSRVEDARQKPMFNYGGKSYMDSAGTVACPSKQLWVAHYPARSADAWNPTTDWNSNGAPLMPYQYPDQYPGCWQWQSYTPEHGHLDLNISTTPEMFGGTGEDDMSAEAEAQINEILTMLKSNDNFYNTVNNAADNHVKLEILIPQVDALFHHVTDGNRLLKIYNYTYSASEVQLPKVLALLEAMGVGGGAVDYDKIRQIVKEEVDARIDQINLKN